MSSRPAEVSGTKVPRPSSGLALLATRPRRSSLFRRWATALVEIMASCAKTDGERLCGWPLRRRVARTSKVDASRPCLAKVAASGASKARGTLSMAAGTVLAKKWGQPVSSAGQVLSPLAATAWQLVAGGASLAVLAAGAAAFLGLLSPVVAITLGWAVAGQTLSP